MTDTSPNWVLLEAVKRCGWTYNEILELQSYYDNDPRFTPLCDMILKREQHPIARKLLCAREANRLWEDSDEEFTVEDACLRAIELYLEGYGE